MKPQQLQQQYQSPNYYDNNKALKTQQLQQHNAVRSKESCLNKVMKSQQLQQHNKVVKSQQLQVTTTTKQWSINSYNNKVVKPQ